MAHVTASLSYERGARKTYALIATVTLPAQTLNQKFLQFRENICCSGFDAPVALEDIKLRASGTLREVMDARMSYDTHILYTFVDVYDSIYRCFREISNPGPFITSAAAETPIFPSVTKPAVRFIAPILCTIDAISTT